MKYIKKPGDLIIIKNTIVRYSYNTDNTCRGCAFEDADVVCSLSDCTNGIYNAINASSLKDGDIIHKDNRTLQVDKKNGGYCPKCSFNTKAGCMSPRNFNCIQNGYIAYYIDEDISENKVMAEAIAAIKNTDTEDLKLENKNMEDREELITKGIIYLCLENQKVYGFNKGIYYVSNRNDYLLNDSNEPIHMDSKNWISHNFLEICKVKDLAYFGDADKVECIKDSDNGIFKKDYYYNTSVIKGFLMADYHNTIAVPVTKEQALEWFGISDVIAEDITIVSENLKPFITGTYYKCIATFGDNKNFILNHYYRAINDHVIIGNNNITLAINTRADYLKYFARYFNISGINPETEKIKDGFDYICKSSFEGFIKDKKYTSRRDGFLVNDRNISVPVNYATLDTNFTKYQGFEKNTPSEHIETSLISGAYYRCKLTGELGYPELTSFKKGYFYPCISPTSIMGEEHIIALYKNSPGFNKLFNEYAFIPATTSIIANNHYRCINTTTGGCFTVGNIYVSNINGFITDNNNIDVPIDCHRLRHFELVETVSRIDGVSIVDNNSNNIININKMESKSMMSGMMAKIKSQFTPEEESNARISINGEIAIIQADGDLISINANNELIKYPEGFGIDIPVYSITKPVDQVVEGDIIKTNNKFYKVKKVDAKGTMYCTSFTGFNATKIAAKDYLLNGTFVRVLFNIFNMNGTTPQGTQNQQNPMGQINPMMMLMMMKDKDSNSGSNDSMMQMMMMQSMMSGGNNNMMANPMMLIAMMNKDGDSDMMQSMMMMQMMQQGGGAFGNMFGNATPKGKVVKTTPAPIGFKANKPKKTDAAKKENKKVKDAEELDE